MSNLKTILWAGVFAPLTLAPLNLAAQSQSEQIQLEQISSADQIIVSATRIPTPINQVGASVTIIDAGQIATRQYTFVADALSDTAGVTIAQNGAFGGQAALRIRGEASGRTLVLLDGVVLNDPSAPSGGFNFANLQVADVEKLSLIHI